MTRARVNHVLLFATAVAVSLSLAGCGNPSPPPTSAAPTSATPSPTPTPTASPAPPAAIPTCTRDNLITTYVPTDNTAGHFHGVINFSNRLDTPCSMNGYPSVWFDNPEAQSKMGAQASYDPVVAPALVVLQPGGILQAALTITDAGVIDCNHTESIALLIAPPLDHPAEVEFDLQHVVIGATPACFDQDAGLLSVGAVVVAP